MNEPEFLSTTRSAYDAIAETYAEMFMDSLRDAPLDRAMLGVLAEYARKNGSKPVADVGCGPGHLTGHLHGLGLDVFGVDLSPEMLAIARREHPGPRFEEGSLTALDVEDGTLGGILSSYSLIHTPPAEIPDVFAEFHRALAPGGVLLLMFFASTDNTRLAWPFDHKVTTAYRLSIGRVADLLRRSGFVEIARLIEQPPERSSRGFELAQFLVRKPADK